MSDKKKSHRVAFAESLEKVLIFPGGYRSGRSRWRETPLTFSIARTRSAGARPVASQPEMVPWDFRPSKRASALWPRTARQASSNASLQVIMPPISAQTGNCVNAYSGSPTVQTLRMGKRAASPPSKFWVRLTEAFAEQNLPTSQNGIALKLEMSQGSVGRWYHGNGLPELETCIEIAIRGRVSVDWLLTGRRPKYPISRSPVIRELIELVEDLAPEAQERILRAAKGEMSLQLEEAAPTQRRA